MDLKNSHFASARRSLGIWAKTEKAWFKAAVCTRPPQRRPTDIPPVFPGYPHFLSAVYPLLSLFPRYL